MNTDDVKWWRYCVDKNRVAKVVETSEKVSNKDNLAKQP